MAKARAEHVEKSLLEVTKTCKNIITKHQREQCLIYEHRVVLPITVEEYQVAQLWSVAEASKNETGGGEGIEVLKNEPFVFDEAADAGNKMMHDNSGVPLKSGQFTHKIYHLQSRVPTFVRVLAPKGSLEIHELAWNAYPFCRTIILNPDYMNEGFVIVIETLHVGNDRGLSENVHGLNEKELKKRVVKKIDIAAPVENARDYKEEWDPTKYQFKKDDIVRGPLKHHPEDKKEHPKWMLHAEPVMCAYKLVSCRFKWFGLQNRVEKFIQNSESRIFTNFHRQVFCWMDKWHGLTMENIREVEEKTKQDLDRARQVGDVKGTKSDYDDDGKK